MEAYMSTWDPASKGGEVFRVTVLEPDGINEFLITSTAVEVRTHLCRIVQAELGAGL